MPELSASEWDAFVSQYPEAHLLQTGAWGELKAAFGWQVVWIGGPGEAGQAPRLGAQVLFRKLPLGFSLAYIPKGPVGGGDADEPWQEWRALWPEIDAACRQRKAVFLKVEPDLWEAGREETADSPAQPRGFRYSLQDIQPARTLLVDLSGDEEQVLARMKQKTRYNIRLAQKKGVVVSPSADLETFHRLMLQTGSRDAFGVHSLAYYQRAYELFHPHGNCELLMAEYQGEPLAALMVFARGRRAWYFYGASAEVQRERMPTYLLQWEAMRWARGRGSAVYDLWGVPDADEPTLEANFTRLTGGLWGVYRFKRGFGGQLRRASGPWDRVYQPLLYAFYRLWARRREASIG
ncbi:MAG: peptidoglycan bridge formation glycyltransferase FemA/FemB family protein [Chloroflexota bacterium]